VDGVSKSFGERRILRSLDLVLSPGMRLGLLGANGSGKTTLLRLLAGLDRPESGRIVPAANLRVVMFDQQRASLDPALSLRRTLAAAGDSVVFQGRAIHVAGWAQRFLFRAEQLDTAVGRLSGGEQARVLIARLMLEPADVLLLDEPTNDLDIPTLEALEESLLEFSGALVLVTHDRYLLDRVSTRLLALDGRGAATEYADYAQWEIGRHIAAHQTEKRAPAGQPGSARAAAAPRPPRTASRPIASVVSGTRSKLASSMPSSVSRPVARRRRTHPWPRTTRRSSRALRPWRARRRRSIASTHAGAS